MAACNDASSACGQLRRVVKLRLLMLSVAVSASSAQFAIPGRYDGLVYGGSVPEQARPVAWGVFVDPLCRNCKAGWPVVMQVAERYCSSFAIVVHDPFPAPFHHNAFFAARAMHIAQMMNASSLVYSLLESVFRNQESFSNPNTKYETPAHVITRLISLKASLGSMQIRLNLASTTLPLMRPPASLSRQELSYIFALDALPGDIYSTQHRSTN